MEPQTESYCIAQRRWITLFISLAIYGAFTALYSGFYHDDAYISLKYAQNLIRGNGLVWNKSEYVEGYTNFLWIILTSAIGGLFHIDLVLTTKLLGIATCLSALIFLGIYKNGKYSYVSLLLASNGCYALWSVGGLEASAFASMLAACVVLSLEHSIVNQPIMAGTFFALLSMMRPEGVMFFFITLIHARFVQKSKHSTLLLIGFLFLYAPYFLWRYVYYGYELMPNTYYAKSGPMPGLDMVTIKTGAKYVENFFKTYGFPIAIFLFLKNIRCFVRQAALPFMLLSLYLVYVIKNGGDHMPGYRFMVHIIPVFYIAVDCGIKNLGTRMGPKSLNSLKNFLLVLNIISTLGITTKHVFAGGPFVYEKALHPLEDPDVNMVREGLYEELTTFPDAAALFGKVMAGYMNNHWPANSTVALNTAGSPIYFSNVKGIDMLGLTNKVIAKRPMQERRLKWQYIPGHARGDGRYVLSRSPDYIVIGGAMGSSKAWFLSDLELLEQEQFRRNYSFDVVAVKVDAAQCKPYKFWNTPGFLPLAMVTDLYRRLWDVPDSSSGPDYSIMRYFHKRSVE